MELSAQLQDLYLQILHLEQLIWTDQHQALTLLLIQPLEPALIQPDLSLPSQLKTQQQSRIVLQLTVLWRVIHRLQLQVTLQVLIPPQQVL